MRRRALVSLLLMSSGFSACSSSSEAPAPSEWGDPTGSVTLEVATVPSDALCLDLKIDGTISTHRKFTLTPGQTATFALTALPLGSVTFTGNIYGVACSSVTSTTSTTWSSDPMTTVLSPSTNPSLKLFFHHNSGRATIGVEFDDGGTPQPCNLSAPFAAAQPLDFAGFVGSRADARLTADELTAYFTSNSDLFVASRAVRTDSFGTPSSVSNLNSASIDSHPSATGNGLTLFFDSNRAGSSHVYSATRASAASAFGAPQQETALDAAGIAGEPYVLPAGTAVYFRAEAAPGDGQIFRASRSGGVVSAPQAMTAFNTSFDESDPVATADDLSVFFSSTRTGGSEGGRDIWVAQRASTTQPFGAPRNLQELNTFEDERPSFVSADGCRLYFGRGEGMYVAQRPK
jgi:WD40-like Beta Propeller Repeat